MMLDIALWLGQLLLVLGLAPLVTGLVRKIRARLLRRIGPPVWQPYLDFWKLLHKEAVVAENASWVYRGAPYAIFAAVFAAAALAPTFATDLMFSRSVDLIAIVALLAAARFILALAGMDVGTAFGGIGASREMMIASLAEPAMLLLVFAVALVAGTTQLSGIAETFIGGVGLRVSLGLALCAFILIALAENARIPVDNPHTHLELTMVHEAMALEYSGRHLAMIEAAAALKLILYFSLLACLFLPFGMATADRGAAALAIGAAAYVAKIAVLSALLPVGEIAVAKMRVFRYPVFLGAAFAASALAVFLLFVSRSF